MKVTMVPIKRDKQPKRTAQQDGTPRTPRFSELKKAWKSAPKHYKNCQYKQNPAAMRKRLQRAAQKEKMAGKEAGIVFKSTENFLKQVKRLNKNDGKIAAWAFRLDLQWWPIRQDQQ